MSYWTTVKCFCEDQVSVGFGICMVRHLSTPAKYLEDSRRSRYVCQGVGVWQDFGAAPIIPPASPSSILSGSKHNDGSNLHPAPNQEMNAMRRQVQTSFDMSYWTTLSTPAKHLEDTKRSRYACQGVGVWQDFGAAPIIPPATEVITPLRTKK
ncbi:hypothetical protein PGT21_006974 [Puccinia graminis f. sp. tritici]|uniref:Uncharacterized protein n=1 Tax=Puccinia graminis f. sp. tritici TaxID=56615 RepID=A0A5B0MBD2_PUCGR|nr:hypothetical protein PGT21_006974 [Puccinia graminis f. sp. tritici]